MELSLLYESQELKLKNYKFNMKEVLKLLNYENIEEDLYKTKEEIIEEFEDTEDKDDKKFVQFLKSISLPEPMLDIYEYMKENNITVSNLKIFKILFDSFRNKKDMLICDDLLDFIGLDHSQFRTFIEKKKILFSLKSIKRENDETIQNDNQHIFMTPDNLKLAVMKLTGKKSANVRIYFDKIQQTFNSYESYLKDYRHKQEIRQKDTQIEEVKRVNTNLSNFVTNVKAKTKNGYIYIATCDANAKQNLFKIGLTINLIKRLSTYNTGRIDADEYFFCFYEKVYNVYKVEQIILDILEDFKYTKNKEMVCLHYTFLEPLIKLVIKNINEPYDYINDLVKTKKFATYDLKPVTVPKLIVSEDIINLRDIEKDVYFFLDKCIAENNFNLTRTNLLDNCFVEQLNKIKIWSHIKKILQWKESKSSVAYNGKNFIITY